MTKKTIIKNNAENKYGTLILIKNTFQISDMAFDTEGRVMWDDRAAAEEYNYSIWLWLYYISVWYWKCPKPSLEGQQLTAPNLYIYVAYK